MAATLTAKLMATQDALGEERVAELCGVKYQMLRLFLGGKRRLGPRPLGTIARNLPALRPDVVQYLMDEWADGSTSARLSVAA